MKKQLIAAASAAALIFSVSACGKDNSTVKISLPDGQEYLKLNIGDEINLGAKAQKDEIINWSCDDSEVASISSDGKLSGMANGIAVITARTESGYDNIGVVVGNGVKGTAAASPNSGAQQVFNGESKITSISNGQTEDETLILSNNDVATFKVNVIPTDCTDPIVFSSSNPSVAEVDAEGTVTPVSRGTVTITATAPNGVNDTFKVFVR